MASSIQGSLYLHHLKYFNQAYKKHNQQMVNRSQMLKAQIYNLNLQMTNLLLKRLQKNLKGPQLKEPLDHQKIL